VMILETVPLDQCQCPQQQQPLIEPPRYSTTLVLVRHFLRRKRNLILNWRLNLLEKVLLQLCFQVGANPDISRLVICLPEGMRKSHFASELLGICCKYSLVYFHPWASCLHWCKTPNAAVESAESWKKT
jgi:hypothetical protein